MNAKWLVPAALIGVVALSCSPPPPEEIPKEDCLNQLDDDADGAVDCADSECSALSQCQAPPECTKQTDCFSGQNYFFFINEPMPRCEAQKCVKPAASIDLHLVLKKNLYTCSDCVRASNIRFIRKTAVDGSPVSCATITALATGNSAADADQIERSNKFNFLAVDVNRIQNAPGSSAVQLNAFSTSTGADFLIWAELWNGQPDSSTKYPTNKRIDWKCYDSGPVVAEILPEHHWPDVNGTPTSRTMNIEFEGPLNP